MKNLTTEKLMNVREISTVLNVSERVVQLTVKTLFPESVKNGITTLLNESQVTRVKLELQSHHNLEGTFEVKTELEKMLIVKQGYQFLFERVDDLEQKNAVLTPKAEAFDRFLGTDNLHRMDEVAQVLQTGKNSLYRRLRELKIFRKQNGYNLPYQKYMDAGYFQVKETVKAIHEVDIAIPVIYATAKGIEYLKKKLA